METKKFKAERNSQIVIDKKFTIQKGDDIEVEYLKDKDGEINFAKVNINSEFIGKFDLQELEQFMTIFFSETL